jgi:hypothetical protein
MYLIERGPDLKIKIFAANLTKIYILNSLEFILPYVLNVFIVMGALESKVITSNSTSTSFY